MSNRITSSRIVSGARLERSSFFAYLSSGSYSIKYFPGESSTIVNFKPMILQMVTNSCAEKLSRRSFIAADKKK